MNLNGVILSATIVEKTVLLIVEELHPVLKYIITVSGIDPQDKVYLTYDTPNLEFAS